MMMFMVRLKDMCEAIAGKSEPLRLRIVANANPMKNAVTAQIAPDTGSIDIPAAVLTRPW
jgi:hypothetical protein